MTKTIMLFATAVFLFMFSMERPCRAAFKWLTAAEKVDVFTTQTYEHQRAVLANSSRCPLIIDTRDYASPRGVSIEWFRAQDKRARIACRLAQDSNDFLICERQFPVITDENSDGGD